jgi:hypothetical protein
MRCLPWIWALTPERPHWQGNHLPVSTPGHPADPAANPRIGIRSGMSALRVELFFDEEAGSWPSELELMAERAGLRLRERHSGWDRRPFMSNSSSHFCVYQRA